MGEVDRLVTQTALAIRDADELEVAASVLDAALRRAKAEVWREAEKEARLEISRGMFTGDYQLACRYLAESYSARAAQIEEGE